MDEEKPSSSYTSDDFDGFRDEKEDKDENEAPTEVPGDKSAETHPLPPRSYN